ncbi:WecB/TagA/CpsF family glycosyltransferase [Pannonibacter sp. Q-1]
MSAMLQHDGDPSSRTVLPGLETVRVGGFQTVLADRCELSEWIAQRCRAIRSGEMILPPALVFSSNGQGIALQGTDPAYDAAMAEADIIHADGMSVVFASKLLTRTPIRGRSATTDLFHDVAKLAEREGLRFFVLGSTEAQNTAAVEAMKRLYPKLAIVGRRHGYFSHEDEEAICAEVVAAGTDVLWVGLGKPKQEIWCARNRHRLTGVGCIKTCGGLYAFLTGEAPRAPDWMQRLGLEWMFRLWQEPQRLFTRYLITNLIASYRIFISARIR